MALRVRIRRRATAAAAPGGGGKARRSAAAEEAPRSRISRGFRFLLTVFGLVATVAGAATLTFLLAARTVDPEVPDLTGFEVEPARRLLAVSGLRLTEAGSRFHDDIPEGRIVFQQPPPGTVFKRGRAVQVFPSHGPTRRRVPRLEGSTLTEARRQLEAAELAVGRVSEVESDYYLRGRVLAQSPAAYSDAAPGAAVSVLLSTGPAPAAFVMPDLIGRRYGEIADELSRAPVRVREVRSGDYPGQSPGVVVRQSPQAGRKVTNEDGIVLTLSR